MQATDKKEFYQLLNDCFGMYEKTATPTIASVWFNALASYPLDAIREAFGRYISSPDDCKFVPKPGDIIRHLNALQPDRPDPEQAWAMLWRFISDERETGVYSDEMRQGWEAAQPLIDDDDRIAARKCFLEVYAKSLEKARSERKPVKWHVSLGTEKERRKPALIEAVKLGRLSADYARSLLPAPETSVSDLGKAVKLLAASQPAESKQPKIDIHRFCADLKAIVSAGVREMQRAERERQQQRMQRYLEQRAQHQAALDELAKLDVFQQQPSSEEF